MVKLEIGDVIFVKVNRFSAWYRWLLAKLIQFFDHTYYHHCILPAEQGIYDDGAKGVKYSTLNDYVGDEICVRRLIIPLTPDEKAQYLSISRQQLGKKYDYMGTLVFQLIYQLTRIWLGPVKNKATKRLYCSEHVFTPIHKIRNHFPRIWETSPGMAYRTTGIYYTVWEGKLTLNDINNLNK